MEIRLLEENKTKNRISFIMRGAPISYANGLRRIMLEDVPTMAIHEVEFKKNSSLLYDEIIAHRLGLVILKTDLKSYNLPDDCPCKGAGCARCQLKLTLKSKGAGLVYASDMKSKDPKVKPVYPKTPIAKLVEGQELELVATACLGSGKVHSKWSPCHAYYKYRPVIDIQKKCDACSKCIEACPLEILEKKAGKVVVNKDKALKCHLCNACVDACEKGAIITSESSSDLIFNIESWGQLTNKEIISQALGIFDKKVSEIEAAVKEQLTRG
ncbi:MAG: DNA-directed RNA polymerase subunit D [archaeon]